MDHPDLDDENPAPTVQRIGTALTRPATIDSAYYWCLAPVLPEQQTQEGPP
jgi:hypothetical protein